MTSTTAWIRPLTETTDSALRRAEVSGSRCRTAQGLFTEWAARLAFPDHFGHNWNAFHDCLRDAVSNVGTGTADQEAAQTSAIVVKEAGHLLVEEPESTMATFLAILSQVVGDADAEPRLLLLLDDTPELLSPLTQRMRKAGYAPTSREA